MASAELPGLWSPGNPRSWNQGAAHPSPASVRPQLMSRPWAPDHLSSVRSSEQTAILRAGGCQSQGRQRHKYSESPLMSVVVIIRGVCGSEMGRRWGGGAGVQTKWPEGRGRPLGFSRAPAGAKGKAALPPPRDTLERRAAPTPMSLSSFLFHLRGGFTLTCNCWLNNKCYN